MRCLLFRCKGCWFKGYLKAMGGFWGCAVFYGVIFGGMDVGDQIKLGLLPFLVPKTVMQD